MNIYKWLDSTPKVEPILTREELNPHIGEPIWTILDLMESDPDRFEASTHLDKLVLKDKVNRFNVILTRSVEGYLKHNSISKSYIKIETNKDWINPKEAIKLYKASRSLLDNKWKASSLEARNKVINLYRS